MSLCEMDDAFDAATATWSDCVLETVNAVHYAKVLLGSVVTPTAGKYRAFVKLTKTADGTEIPVLKAADDVVVTTG